MLEFPFILVTEVFYILINLILVAIRDVWRVGCRTLQNLGLIENRFLQNNEIGDPLDWVLEWR